MRIQDPADRQPKGDHNRRISLGLDPDQFAAEVGITTEELREYERTSPDHRFDPAVAARVGAALERLEAKLPNAQTGRQEPAGGWIAEDVAADKPEVVEGDHAPTGSRYSAPDITYRGDRK
jgi:hypothetical protein